MTGTLKLTRAQRAKLFECEPVYIGGKGTCPVEPGYVYRLSSLVELQVEDVQKAKFAEHHANGTVKFVPGWKLRYELRDRRDPTEFIRRTPTVHVSEWTFDDDGFPEEPTEDVVKDAAHDSAYTWRNDRIGAGNIVDEDSQKRFSAAAKEQNLLRRATEHDKADTKRMTQKLRDLKAQARRKGIDISPEMRAVKEQLAKAEDRLTNGDEKAA